MENSKISIWWLIVAVLLTAFITIVAMSMLGTMNKCENNDVPENGSNLPELKLTYSNMSEMRSLIGYASDLTQGASGISLYITRSDKLSGNLDSVNLGFYISKFIDENSNYLNATYVPYAEQSGGYWELSQDNAQLVVSKFNIKNVSEYFDIVDGKYRISYTGGFVITTDESEAEHELTYKAEADSLLAIDTVTHEDKIVYTITYTFKVNENGLYLDSYNKVME